MTITRVVDGNTSAATNLNQLIDLMEGAESIDFLLTSLVATDFKIRLADAAAARKFIIQDSGGATVAYIDSDGNASFTSIALSSLVVPASASPAQTADASVVWDSDGDFLTIGDGTSRKAFYPDTAGSDIAAASTLSITDSRHRVTGSTTITAIANKPAGYIVVLTFASTPQLTHSSSLRLAGAANYTVTAEETLAFESDGTNWREVGRKPAAAATTPGWTKVSAGTGTATNVNLSSLSGYRRYKVLITIRGANAALSFTVNGVGGTAYKYGTSRTTATDTFDSVYSTGAAAFTVASGIGTSDASAEITVMHRGAASGTIQALWNSAFDDSNVFATQGGGIMTTTQSSISAIAISWSSSVVYDYVLFGSNDVS